MSSWACRARLRSLCAWEILHCEQDYRGWILLCLRCRAISRRVWTIFVQIVPTRSVYEHDFSSGLSSVSPRAKQPNCSHVDIGPLWTRSLSTDSAEYLWPVPGHPPSKGPWTVKVGRPWGRQAARASKFSDWPNVKICGLSPERPPDLQIAS